MPLSLNGKKKKKKEEKSCQKQRHEVQKQCHENKNIKMRFKIQDWATERFGEQNALDYLNCLAALIQVIQLTGKNPGSTGM